MNRPTRSKLCERRREVANLAVQGGTQAAIARHRRLRPGTVSRDLGAMRNMKRIRVHRIAWTSNRNVERPTLNVEGDRHSLLKVRRSTFDVYSPASSTLPADDGQQVGARLPQPLVWR